MQIPFKPNYPKLYSLKSHSFIQISITQISWISTNSQVKRLQIHLLLNCKIQRNINDTENSPQKAEIRQKGIVQKRGALQNCDKSPEPIQGTFYKLFLLISVHFEQFGNFSAVAWHYFRHSWAKKKAEYKNFGHKKYICQWQKLEQKLSLCKLYKWQKICIVIKSSRMKVESLLR